MLLAKNGVRGHLHGAATGLLTPFDDSPDIKHGELTANATTSYDGGIRMFFASTNISEYHPLTQQERVDVTVAAVDALSSDVYVPVGVGGSTAGTRELIGVYDRIGVNRMMIVPPDRTYVRKRGLFRYCEKLAEASTAPLVSCAKGFNPPINYLHNLTGLDDVVGTKYAIEDAVKLGTAASATGDDVVWVGDLAEPFAVPFWNEGIEGFSVGVSNFHPGVGLTLFETLTEENWGHVREFQNVCLPYQDFHDQIGQSNSFDGAISVPVVKRGFELAGLHGEVVREPIRSLPADDECRAEELYDQLGDDIERLID